MKNVLMQVAGMALLCAGMGGLILAFPGPVTPEIDPASGINAIPLLAGAVLLIRGRKR